MNTKKEIKKSPRWMTILRWTTNGISLLLFALWGAFFIEHLSWFSQPDVTSLPWQVWLLQVFHLALLIGYLMMFKWPRIASFIILISSVVFFASAAGQNFVPFTLISIIPVLLYAIIWWKQARLQLTANAA
jgi:hypothetical protein